LQAFIDKNETNYKINFFEDIYPQIKEMVTEAIRSVFLQIDSGRRKNTFELFGFDFMIDKNYKVYLIEANINPCLEISSKFSGKFIPTLIDNVLRYFKSESQLTQFFSHLLIFLFQKEAHMKYCLK